MDKQPKNQVEVDQNGFLFLVFGVKDIGLVGSCSGGKEGWVGPLGSGWLNWVLFNHPPVK